jgi:probable phosphoglycerate mutase
VTLSATSRAIARVFIVRHGNTFAPGEAPRRIGGRTDLALVDAGRDQARALGRYFADCGLVFDSARCGPLLRTRETARLLLSAAGHDGPATIVEWLREIDHGPDEDRPEAEVLARIGQPALDAWDRDGIPPEDWQVDAAARRAAWRDLFASATGTMLIVTSNGAARFAFPGAAKLRTGAYGEVVTDAQGRPMAKAWDVRP